MGAMIHGTRPGLLPRRQDRAQLRHDQVHVAGIGKAQGAHAEERILLGRERQVGKRPYPRQGR